MSKKTFFFIAIIVVLICIIFSNPGRATCAIVLAIVFGVTGFGIGTKIGIASGGGAQNGGCIVAIVGIIIGALAGNSIALAIQIVVPDPVPTAKPLFTPNPTAQKISSMHELVLPAKLEGSEGWVLKIEEIKFLETLDAPKERHRPKNGIFLWLGGKITNFTDKYGCIRGRQFVLRDNKKQYQISREIMDVAHNIYGLNYPGFFSGQCLNYDETVDSFLIFDVPKDAIDIWLRLDESNIQLGDMSILVRRFTETNVTDQGKH